MLQNLQALVIAIALSALGETGHATGILIENQGAIMPDASAGALIIVIPMIQHQALGTWGILIGKNASFMLHSRRCSSAKVANADPT